MSEPHDVRLPSPRELKVLIEAERAETPFLLWRDDAGEQHILMLPAGRGKLTIGRREASDVPLTWDAKVSRAHALLEPVGQEWTLVDDGLSRNGSWVNGSRVHGRRRLHDRDRMCFGDTRVLFRDTAEERGSVSTARATGSPEAASLTERKRRVLIALCRPVVDLSSTTPATNPQIAAEVHLSVDAVKGVLRELFDQFGLGELGQNEKRSRLVAKVIDSGLLAPHDF